MEDLFKNLGLMMPMDIMKHESGKSMIGVNPEDKMAFAKWFFENGHTEEGTTHEGRDELFLQWKQNNIV